MKSNNLLDELSKGWKNNNIKNIIAIILILAFLYLAISTFLPSEKKSSNMGNSILTSGENHEEEIVTQTEKDSYEAREEQKLKSALQKMSGVGEVEVTMYFESGEIKVPAENKNEQTSTTEETDNEGGKRVNKQNNGGSQVVMSNDEPFIIKTYKPQITGVLIIAEGASDSKIKYDIEVAVSKLYDLSLDKVNVYSMAS